jgi:plasmid stabilization system protein ParE
MLGPLSENMTRLRISAAALADLDDIWFHIAKDSAINADRFLDRLLASVTETLSTHRSPVGLVRNSRWGFGAFHSRTT